MEEYNFIKFLGTAGARFVVAKQLRSSAGTYLCAQGKNIIIDPGPGTLVKLASSKPAIDINKIDVLILTHAHIDHSNDINIMIDSMTNGGFKKHGILFTTKECLEGENAVVLKYLRDFLEEIVILEADQQYKIDKITFRTSSAHQHNVETYGLKFDIKGLKVSFMVDTKFFPELIENYKDSNIMVMNVVRFAPHESGEVLHLSVDDAKDILSVIKPQKAILTHFGMTMLKNKPWEIAKKLSDELGIEVIAASDGMTVDLGFNLGDTSKLGSNELPLFNLDS